MSETKQVNVQSFGFLNLLCILFIGLKLGGVINWSWWWVLAPLWAPVVGLFSILFFGFLFYCVCWGISKCI